MKRLLLFGFLCVLCASALYSEDKTKVEELIKQLGNDDFQKREFAQSELTKYGEKLIEQYRIAKREKKQEEINKPKVEIERFAQAIQNACKDKDPEIKMRANQIHHYFYSFTQPKIAFVLGVGIDEEIYVIGTDGRNPKRLTENKSSDNYPTWSPDGAKIAFASDQDSSFVPDIYVMDSNGKNLTRLTENKVYDSQPNWSPDGTKITFVSERDGNREVYVMAADGKNQKRLTGNPSYDDSPAWSSDGTRIAFTSSRDGNPEIYLMDTDGKNLMRLTQNKASDKDPAWHPDGTKIAFVSNRDGDDEIYIMDVNGKNQTKLIENKNKIKSSGGGIAFYCSSPPAWNPAGAQIAFVSRREGNTFDIYLTDIHDKNRKRLVEDIGFRWGPSWNPLSLPEISILFSGEKSPDLSGSDILMIIAPQDFRDEEYQISREQLEKAGAKIMVASSSLDESVGMLKKVKVKPDILLKDVKVDNYDAVIFVGGVGAKKYFQDKEAHRIALETVEKNKILAAICLAPAILANAGVLKDKKATVYESEKDILKSGGVRYENKSVITDGLIITANGPDAASEFAETIKEALRGK
jgi:PfpI family intracellular protease